MTKEEQINEIKRIIEKWGETTSGELELNTSPCINSIGDTITQLIERFGLHEIDAVIYHNGNEIETDYFYYRELSDDIINEIYNIMEQYELDMLKTEKRCQD